MDEGRDLFLKKEMRAKPIPTLDGMGSLISVVMNDLLLCKTSRQLGQMVTVIIGIDKMAASGASVSRQEAVSIERLNERATSACLKNAFLDESDQRRVRSMVGQFPKKLCQMA